MMRRTALALFVSALAGCGGGGGDAPPAPSTPATTAFPVESVLVKVATTAGNYGGNFTDTTGTYNIAISLAPGADGRFTSTSAVSKTYTTTTVLKKNGVTAATSSSTTYFTISPLAVIGQRVGSDVINATQRTAVPATATVGTSGPFFVATEFINGSTFNTSQVTGTWSLEADTASTAFVCLNTRVAGTVMTTEADCFKVNAAGTIVGFKATTTTNARSTNANPVVDTFVFQ